MATYRELPLVSGFYEGDEDDNTFVAAGEQTVGGDQRASYSYVVYNLSTYGGDDVVYLSNLTAIDPSGVNPPSRQVVDLGAGNDFASLSSISAVSVFGGDGNDTIIKTDLRSRWTDHHIGSIENGDAGGAFPTIVGRPVGLSQDEAWVDFDILDGGAGDDTITSGNGPDWVYGGDGNDFISLGSGNNVAFGGDGDDTILVEGLMFTQVLGNIPPNSLTSFAWSNNAIWGGAGDDVITIRWVQQEARDTFVAVVNGDEGNDTITVESINPVWVTGGDGDDTIVVSSSAYRYVYNIFYSETKDVVWGGDGNDVVYTGLGDDLIVGGAGHDWLFPEFGSDQIYLGEGGTEGDGATDRLSLGLNRHRPFDSAFVWPDVLDIDVVYDFEPQSRAPEEAGYGDVIDVAAMFAADPEDALTYVDENPFATGKLRLVEIDGVSTGVEARNSEDGWDLFLVLYGVLPGELDTTAQADVSGGLSVKTGGDFLWYVG